MIPARKLALSLALLLLSAGCIWTLMMTRHMSHWLPSHSVQSTPVTWNTSDQISTRHNETWNTSDQISTRHNETWNTSTPVGTHQEETWIASEHVHLNKSWMRYGRHDLSRFFSPLMDTPEFEELKVFILDFPFTNKSTSPICNSTDPRTVMPGRHRLVHLYTHSSRTFNMSQADLFFSSCAVESFRDYPCRCTYHNLTHDPAAKTSAERRKANIDEIYAQMDYFHSLKANGSIKPHAWLVIENEANSLVERGLMDDSKFSDLSFVSLQALGSDSVGRTRFKDVSTVRVVPDGTTLWIDKGTWTPRPRWRIVCSVYKNSGSLAFFKGRRHGSWNSEVSPDQRIDVEDLMRRHRLLRFRMSEALEGNPLAKELGIHFHSQLKLNRATYTEEGKLFDYDNYTKTSHFCFVPAGNQAWSFRFYEAMEHGCIPVVISGGWLLPYSPAIQYRHLVVRISENFDFKNVHALKNKMLQSADWPLCEQHRNVKRVWEFIKTDDHEFQLWLAAIKLRFMQHYITPFFEKK